MLGMTDLTSAVEAAEEEMEETEEAMGTETGDGPDPVPGTEETDPGVETEGGSVTEVTTGAGGTGARIGAGETGATPETTGDAAIALTDLTINQRHQNSESDVRKVALLHAKTNHFVSFYQFSHFLSVPYIFE